MHLSINLIGDAFADIYFYLEAGMPQQGGDARLKQPVHTVAGGSGLNTATHLSSILRHFWNGSSNNGEAEQNERTSNVSLQTVINENDDYGKLIIDHSRKNQFALINRRVSNQPSCFFGTNEAVSHHTNGEKSTGHCAVIVSNGDRSFMTHLGCMEDFKGSHILTHSPDNIISKSKPSHQHIHIAGYYNISGFFNGELASKLGEMNQLKRSENNKFTISLVPQHDATDSWDGGLMEVLQHVNFLILSEIEAEHISRYEDGDEEGRSASAMLDHAAAFFYKKSPATYVIITRGPEGAVILFEGKCIASQATSQQISNPIDATGAGDSFAAGFMYGFLSFCGESKEEFFDGKCKYSLDALKRGLQWGCANGTCSVQVQGASVPSSKRSIEQMLQGWQ